MIRRRNILQNLLVDPENLIDGIITDCVDDHLHSMFCRFPYTGVQLGIRAHFDTAMSRTIGIILLQARTLGTDCAIAEKLTGPDGQMTVVEINFRTLSKISLFVRRGVRPECVMKRAVKAELILAAFVQCFQVVNIFKGGAHVVHIGYTVLKKLLLCGKQSIFSL